MIISKVLAVTLTAALLIGAPGFRASEAVAQVVAGAAGRAASFGASGAAAGAASIAGQSGAMGLAPLSSGLGGTLVPSSGAEAPLWRASWGLRDARPLGLAPDVRASGPAGNAGVLRAGIASVAAAPESSVAAPTIRSAGKNGKAVLPTLGGIARSFRAGPNAARDSAAKAAPSLSLAGGALFDGAKARADAGIGLAAFGRFFGPRTGLKRNGVAEKAPESAAAVWKPTLVAAAKVFQELKDAAKTDPAGARARALELARPDGDPRIEVKIGALRFAASLGAAEIAAALTETLSSHPNWYMRREAARLLAAGVSAASVPLRKKGEGGLLAAGVSAASVPLRKKGEGGLLASLEKAAGSDENASVRLMARRSFGEAGGDLAGLDETMKTAEAQKAAKAEAALAQVQAQLDGLRTKSAQIKQKDPAARLKTMIKVMLVMFLGLWVTSTILENKLKNEPPKGAPGIVQVDGASQKPGAAVKDAGKDEAPKTIEEKNARSLKDISESMDRAARAQEETLKLLQEQQAEAKKGGGIGGAIWTMFLMFAPIVLLVWLFRKMSGGAMKQVKDIGGVKKRFDGMRTGKRFSDVAGIDDSLVEIQELIDFLKNPKRYRDMGARIPKGVLLHGPPGTGKTLLAKALAGETDATFISISGSDFIEMFVGVGASRVRDLFAQAQSRAPAIVFIDELDAIGKARGRGAAVSGHDEREQTLNQLLVELDGFDNSKGVIVVAATNRPEILDPALLRPGRFDRQIVVDAADLAGREGILQVHAKNARLDPEVDLLQISRNTPGASGATLENVINEAALLAVRRGGTAVKQADLMEAIDRMSIGQKRSMFLSEKQRVKIAYHESGHALANMLVAGKGVSRLTIVPHGSGALGFMAPEPEEDILLQTKSELENRIVTMLGGRAAEELLYGETSTGPSNDLEQATRLARAMVTKLGMSEEFGLSVAVTDPENPWAGSGLDEALVRREVNKILDAQMKRAKELLASRRGALEALKDALIERETLLKEEIEAIVRRHQ